MSTVLLVARLSLVAVFGVAGVAKLADLDGSRQAVAAFGIGRGFAPVVGTLLPVAELVIAIALLGQVTARWGALGALLLLGAFSAAIGVALAGGRRLDCHCLGRLHSAVADRSTLARNMLLAGVAGLIVVAGPGRSLAGAVGGLSSGVVAALVGGAIVFCLIGLQAAFSYQLLRQNARLLTRVQSLEARFGLPDSVAAGLAVGSRAPAFSLPGIDGHRLTLDGLLAFGRPLVLVFSHPDCGPCRALTPELSRWQQSHGAKVTVALISRAAGDEGTAGGDDHTLEYVLWQREREVADLYQSWVTPSAVAVDVSGGIASRLAEGADEIMTLLTGQIPEDREPSLRVVHSPGDVHPAGSRERAVRATVGVNES